MLPVRAPLRSPEVWSPVKSFGHTFGDDVLERAVICGLPQTREHYSD